MNAEDVVVNLIALSGGRLVGRTRFQKVAYLLDGCGAHLDLPFTYYHYGPYSFDLADGWEDAEIQGRINIREEIGRYGVPYSIFELLKSHEEPADLANMSARVAEHKLQKMSAASDIVLELAATIVFLRREENYEDRASIEELKARKSRKATDPFVSKAIALLRELGLQDRSDP